MCNAIAPRCKVRGTPFFMSNESHAGLAVFIFSIISFVVGFTCGSGFIGDSLRSDAIKARVGEWYLDDKYEKRFRFKEPQLSSGSFWSIVPSPDGYHGSESTTPKKKK